MKGLTIWFTGLPCSGKTTLALRLNEELEKRGYLPEALDGDVTRKYLSKGLGFSKEDRDENIRRVGFVCSLLTRHGAVTTAAFVSPYESIREEIRGMIGQFVEVFVKCSVETCIERDVKGMYKKALKGEILNFTGVSDPYEEPRNPEIVVETDKESVEESLQIILARLEELGFIHKTNPQIQLPPYIADQLEESRKLQGAPDLESFLIRILGQHLQENSSGKGDSVSTAEELDKIREKLKKLGYLN